MLSLQQSSTVAQDSNSPYLYFLQAQRVVVNQPADSLFTWQRQLESTEKMCQSQRSSSQQTESFSREQSVAGGQSSDTTKEDWTDVTDPSERRKIQNKLAQRRFRDRIKEQKEEAERELENQRKAGSSYVPAEPESIDTNQTLSGLPWGGISMRHVLEQGKSRHEGSQRTIRGGSANPTDSSRDEKNNG